MGSSKMLKLLNSPHRFGLLLLEQENSGSKSNGPYYFSFTSYNREDPNRLFLIKSQKQ